MCLSSSCTGLTALRGAGRLRVQSRALLSGAWPGAVPESEREAPGPTLTDRFYRVLEWMQEKTGRLVVDDVLIEYRLDDLWGYYKDAAFRADARDRLRAVLERYEGRTLLLAAHSMGGLIAYDVLRLMERQGRCRGWRISSPWDPLGARRDQAPDHGGAR